MDPGIAGGSYTDGVLPPAFVPAAPKPPKLIHRSQMDPAMLTRRVEPIYPPLAIMARCEGHVELRAVISTDGSISSLRVLSGHPLLIEAAKAAVLQWRYRPTTLGGQPVEVDTFITVIFVLKR
jgi:protein TonB